MNPSESVQVMRACTRFLNYGYTRRPQQVFADLADYADPEWRMDNYGNGDLIADFERDVATVLGKPAAVFMPSGTMCQQIVLRVWAERARNWRVAFHPTCHLELREQQGYRLLHGLQGTLVGDPHRLITLNDVEQLAEPVGTLLLELPQREIGGLLPVWDDLVALTTFARQRGMRLHLDGARLWESGPFYARPYAEIASLFDSVYVSFYKGLGGIAGAMLAGPEDIIAEARVWQRRHGGNLPALYPYVIAARRGMELRLPRMAQYHDHAKAIAATLNVLPDITITPNPPQTNMAHVYLRGDPEALKLRALDSARRSGVWLFGGLMTSPLPDWNYFEMTVNDAALDIPVDEVRALFSELLIGADR
jgi:threonine aldolase